MAFNGEGVKSKAVDDVLIKCEACTEKQKINSAYRLSLFLPRQ